jgi:outer membrane protease
MRNATKKVCTSAIIVTFILFFYTFSFAQTENIKGVQFKDGSIIYGKVIKISVTDIQIETKDGKIVPCKFDDVENFIKMEDIRGIRFKDGSVIYGSIVEMNSNMLIIIAKDNNIITRKLDDVASFTNKDEKEDAQVKKEIFSIAIGTEIMWGNTAYQIGYPITYPNGSQDGGYFPFSKLEWPLDTWLARIDAGLNIGDSWRINGVLKKNLSNPGSTMKDSDWLTASNPGRLDVYSESNISKFDAWIFDVDVEWAFLKRQSWSLYAGLGYQYQMYDFEAKLVHQYSPSGLPGYDVYGDDRVAIAYEITYSMPYIKIGTDFKIKDKFTLDGSFAWSPIVKAKDEDNHLLRENGGKISTGEMDGNAIMVNLSAKYNFTSSWFLKGGFQYTRIYVDGEQYQIYGNGVQIGTVREKIDSNQYSLSLAVGYAF